MKKGRRNRKPIRRALRRPFEWLGIGLGLLVMVSLPRRPLLGLCDFLSAAMYFFDRRGRARSRQNLRYVLGRQLPKWKEDLILRRSYRNMARSVGHAFWTCCRARARVEVSGEMSEACKVFLAANKPAVTVSGHIGCWEILSQLALLEGHRMMSVAKDMGTPGMTRLLMRARRSIGQEIVHADGAFRVLMQGLKEGKSLGLLVDQVVKPQDGGIWVRFFGHPIPVSAAPAFFAAKGKVPIIVAWSRPLKDGRYRCEKVSTYRPEEARDIWRMTQRCLHDLETVIRRHPSCWVLNYNYGRTPPKPEDVAQLEEREAKSLGSGLV